MGNEKKSELDKIRARRQQRSVNDVADWQAADPNLVLQAIAVVAFKGGALRFGYTRDGGAFAVGIYLSNDRYTEYIRPAEDIDAYLQTLIEDLGQ